MNNPGLFQAKWNLRRWALCNLLAIGLLCFWLWPTGQMLCVIFDEWLFHLLNDPLASHSTWLHVWAVASLRPFDAVVGVILLTLLIRGDWVFKPEVRQAINLAFDKNSYLKAVFEGTAEAANGIYPPNTWSYAKDLPGYPQDIAKARTLLDRAGLKDGFKTTIWTRPTGSLLNPNPNLGAQLLQADLAKIGIQAEIRVIEWGELIRRAKAGEHDLLFMGWAGDNGDPDNFLTPQFSCAAVKSGTNFARYCDPALDKLISAGKTTSEQGVRTKLYQQAQAQIQQQPVVAVECAGDCPGGADVVQLAGDAVHHPPLEPFARRGA